MVEDFKSLDGKPLDGAAVVATNEIILDSGLEGDALRAVLAEEVVARAQGNGASVTTANSITATRTESNTEVLQSDDYDEDYRMTVGQHEVIADVNVMTEYTIWLALYENSEGRDPDAYIKMDMQDTRVVEDYFLDIVYTQHEVDTLELDENMIASFDSTPGFA